MHKKVGNFQENIQNIAKTIFSESDIAALKEHNISLEKAVQQFNQLREGVPSVQPIAAVTEESGFLQVFSQEQIKAMIEKYEKLEKDNPSVYFVPAAGAASRMFKLLKTVVTNDAPDLPGSLEMLSEKEQQSVSKLFDAIKTESMAFCNELEDQAHKAGFDLHEAIVSQDVVSIFKFILEDMDYANLPKAVIPAHYYAYDDVRTPLEEHVRFLLTLQGTEQRLHLAISPEHEQVIKSEIANIIAKLKDEGIEVDIEFSTSIQQLATDAIAYNVDKNEPLHDEDGQLVMRKAGHGSLISNLDELAQDYSGIFLRNIDNVKPDNFTDEIADYKKVMRVKANELETQSFGYIESLMDTQLTGLDAQNVINEALEFIEQDLKFQLDRSVFADKSIADQKQLLIGILDRPIAVVAYVPLEPGQKGGGGFVSEMNIEVNGQTVTVNKATTVEGQELEGGQQNPIFAEEATHFNPVDIYLTTRRYNGEAFKLSDFADKNRAMVDGKDLIPGINSRIWENPGLWNGSMAEMFQVSIHAPKETFAPIKEFHNTLDPAHTPGATEPTGE